MIKAVARVYSCLTNYEKAYIIKSVMKRIYLDHAATTPLDQRVFEKMAPYFMENFGNADSPHALGRKAMSAVDFARDQVSELIHAAKNEVYFTSGGTEADNWAVIGAANAQAKCGKRKVIVSSIEHHAVLYAAEKLKNDGFEICYLPVNEGGRVEINALEEVIDEQTALVAVMAVNNETGVLQPIKALAEIAHAHGALFFTDAVQAAPYLPIDVKEWGVDLLSFSAHKFYGPKGVGALYIKNGVKIEKHVGGGEQERGLRGGTLNVPSVVGFAAAYQKCVEEREENNQKIQTLANAFMQELSILDGIQRNGDKNNALDGVLNLQIDGVENTSLLFKMDLQGVCMAAGSACASASIKPSHVLTAMGLSEKQAKSSVRISFGKNNELSEVIDAAKIFVQTIERLRKKDK